MVAEKLICHHTPVTTVDEQWHLIESVWAAVPVHSIQSLYDTMQRLITAAILAVGGCSKC